MVYPPPVTKNERRVLEVVRRGHPHRTSTVRTGSGTSTVNALEWSEVQIESGLDQSKFGDCIAHLVAGRLISSGSEMPGMFARLGGAKERHYFWITQLGQRFLAETPIDALPDVPALPKRSELKGSDIDDAVRIYENSLSHQPYVTSEQVAWASTILDDDIRNEVAKSASELEAMWVEFERRFGHRGPAKVGRESELRDPVAKRTAVRTFRAKDEQCRRLGFPPSRKPGAWLTHYRGGDVGLEPAPWQTGDATPS